MNLQTGSCKCHGIDITYTTITVPVQVNRYTKCILCNIAYCIETGETAQFVPCNATQSAVMPQYVVCPSVCLYICLSVTFRNRDHTGWNTSKIISRPNFLRHLLTLAPTWAIWCNGNTPILGWNKGGVRSTKTCNIFETVQDRTKITMTD